MPFPIPNENGVYDEKAAQCFPIILKKAQAEIRVLQIEAGWVCGYGCDYSEGNMAGVGCPISACNIYPDRASAIARAVEGVARHAAGIIRHHDSIEGQKSNAAKILEWCQELLNGGVVKQAELFA